MYLFFFFKGRKTFTLKIVMNNTPMDSANMPNTERTQKSMVCVLKVFKEVFLKRERRKRGRNF